jgi:hypothetical protein
MVFASTVNICYIIFKMSEVGKAEVNIEIDNHGLIVVRQTNNQLSRRRTTQHLSSN